MNEGILTGDLTFNSGGNFSFNADHLVSSAVQELGSGFELH